MATSSANTNKGFNHTSLSLSAPISPSHSKLSYHGHNLADLRGQPPVQPAGPFPGHDPLCFSERPFETAQTTGTTATPFQTTEPLRGGDGYRLNRCWVRGGKEKEMHAFSNRHEELFLLVCQTMPRRRLLLLFSIDQFGPVTAFGGARGPWDK